MKYTIEFEDGVYNVMLDGKIIYSTRNHGAAEMYVTHMLRAQ